MTPRDAGSRPSGRGRDGDASFAESAAAPGGRTGSAEAGLGAAARAGGSSPRVNNTYIGLFYVAHGAPVLRARRHSRADHAHAARACRRTSSSATTLYNQLFTMHGTVMMFLFAVPAVEAMGVFLLPNMQAARDLPFPRLSRLRVLGVFRRRPRLLLQPVLRPRAGRRLVHVSAADELRSTRRASTPISGCSASASSRSRRSPARSRSSSACSGPARPGMTLDKLPVYRLGDAGLRRDDRLRLSGGDPRDDCCSSSSAPSTGRSSSPRRAAIRCSGSTCSGSSAIRRSTSSSCPPPAWCR